MIGALIAIGDELTSGRVTNTTSGYAARQLFLLGHEIRAMHTIGDDIDLIGATLRRPWPTPTSSSSPADWGRDRRPT